MPANLCVSHPPTAGGMLAAHELAFAIDPRAEFLEAAPHSARIRLRDPSGGNASHQSAQNHGGAAGFEMRTRFLRDDAPQPGFMLEFQQAFHL